MKIKCPAKINEKKTAQQYLEMWQWNCRSFPKKRQSLRQYIDQYHVKADVICIPEAGPNVALLGYKVIIDKENPRIATLINKDLTAIEHKLSSSELAHASLIEIIANMPRNIIRQSPEVPFTMTKTTKRLCPGARYLMAAM